LISLGLAVPGFGQYREYAIYGKVLDPQKRPLEGVEIALRDIETSRSYTLKTKKDGEFKFAGLPHGVYKVAFKKEGYATKEDEWKFETPQPTMLRVEIPPIILVSQEFIQEAQRLRQAEAAVLKGAEKIKQGDLDGAIAALKDVLEKNPNDANALYLLGLAFLKKNMIPEASDAFLQVTQLSPNFAAAFSHLGVCYQRQNQPEKAILEYRKALEMDPSNPDVSYNLGLILFGLTRIDEAQASFEKALSLRPDDPVYLEMAGRCYINKADFIKALECLEKAKAAYNDPERAKFLDELIVRLKEQIKK
jgi:tetratricopeptide (TPR) repeat protein